MATTYEPNMDYTKMNLEYAPAKVIIGTYEFTNEEYRIDSISISRGCYDGNSVGVGSAYVPTCSVTMQNVEGIQNGTQFKIQFNIGGVWEDYGTYTIENIPEVSQIEDEIISFTGSGNMQKLDITYNMGIYSFGTTAALSQFQSEFRSRFGFELVFDLYVTTKLTERKMNVFPARKNKDDRKYEISWKEFLQGLAILCGANLVEQKDGSIMVQELYGGVFQEVFGKETYNMGYSVSPVLHELRSITVYGEVTGFESLFYDAEEQYNQEELGPYLYYSGAEIEEESKKRKFFVTTGMWPHTSHYDFTVVCNWLGASIDWSGSSLVTEPYNPGAAGNWQITSYKTAVPLESLGISNIAFHTGNFEFAGINEGIELGKTLVIEVKGGTKQLYVGEVTYEWDGGFRTVVSSSLGEQSDSEVQSTVSSSVNSYSNYAQILNAGMKNYMSLNYANINFSNIKDSTISGSKFIDGSITGSKIEDSTITNSKILKGSLEGSSFKDGTITNSLIADSTLTGAKIKDATIGFAKVDQSFIADLTANEAYIANLIAETAKLGYVTADEVNSQIGQFGYLTADSATIKALQAQDVEITGSLSALYGQFNTLNAKAITTDNLSAKTAELGYMTAEQADLKYADIKLGNIETADIGLLFANVGLIDRATIIDGHVTGFLDAVEVNADKITAGTLVTDRLVIRDSADPTKSIIYEINNISGALQAVQGNTLNGEVLTDRTINADKIIAKSITANELDVEKIFADSAVIDKISVGVAEVIDLDAERITSGFIDTERINAADILSQHAQFGKEYVTVDAGNESTMFTPDNVHIYNEIGGTKLQDGYIINSNASRKNIVPFCNYTDNDLLPGDVLAVTATYKYDIQQAQDGVSAFAYFIGSDGSLNAEGKVLSAEKIIGSPNSESTMKFNIVVPKEIVKHYFGNGDVDYSYVVFGIMNEYSGATMYLKSATVIKAAASLRVVGSSKIDNIVVDEITINDEINLEHLHLPSWLKADGGAVFRDTVRIYPVGGNDAIGTYLHTDGSITLHDGSNDNGIVYFSNAGVEWLNRLKINTTKENEYTTIEGILHFTSPVTFDKALTVTGVLTAKNDISLNGALEIVHATPYIDFHFGKSAADYTTRLIESESGKLTCTGTFKANVLYEGGKSLVNKYCVVKTGTKSAVGTGGWKQYQVSFGVTYATEPFVNVMDTSKFATENVNFDGYIGDSTNGYTGFYYSVYTPTTTFTYATRWWSVGRVK